jgi:hypothetical protein
MMKNALKRLGLFLGITEDSKGKVVIREEERPAVAKKKAPAAKKPAAKKSAAPKKK